MSEDLFEIRSDVSGLQEELKALGDGLTVANKNSGALQINLSKLKSKVDTNRARATGAVCNSVFYSSQTTRRRTWSILARISNHSGCVLQI